MRTALALALALLAACAGPRPGPSAAQSAFWTNLSALCGKAYEGRITSKVGGGPGPDPYEGKILAIHAVACPDTEIRLAFHVGSNRSRTWVFRRGPFGLRLEHDHRHEDGTPETLTLYGGDAVEPGTPLRQEFPADGRSKSLFVKEGLPASADNVWIVELEPDRVLRYSLVRPGREFRMEFDLSRPVAPPGATGRKED